MDSRHKLLSLARDFWQQRTTSGFVPGETYIPVSGKVLDSDDLVQLIDASLDMWLTEGRFAKQFEKALLIGAR